MAPAPAPASAPAPVPAAGQVIPGKTICIIKLLLGIFAVQRSQFAVRRSPGDYVNRIIIIILAFLYEPIPFAWTRARSQVPQADKWLKLCRFRCH